MSAALRHFVEQAIGTRLDDFEDWFPPVFDWRALCADVPEMVAKISQDWIDADDAEISEGLRRRAQDYFRHGHLATLAVLVAKTADEEDPESVSPSPGAAEHPMSPQSRLSTEFRCGTKARLQCRRCSRPRWQARARAATSRLAAPPAARSS